MISVASVLDKRPVQSLLDKKRPLSAGLQLNLSNMRT